MEMVKVKAMLGSIPAPNSGSFVEKKEKNIRGQIGQNGKKTFKKREIRVCTKTCKKNKTVFSSRLTKKPSYSESQLK
jgi:hypothetical protein